MGENSSDDATSNCGVIIGDEERCCRESVVAIWRVLVEVGGVVWEGIEFGELGKKEDNDTAISCSVVVVNVG
jgi:hypothetical protein